MPEGPGSEADLWLINSPLGVHNAGDRAGGGGAVPALLSQPELEGQSLRHAPSLLQTHRARGFRTLTKMI